MPYCTFTINVPPLLYRFGLRMLLLYRKIKYGYAFRRIELTKGQVAIVDQDDFDRLNKHKWYAKEGKMTYYAARTVRINKKKYTIR